ncbi:MAG: YceI family protein [Leptospiraceae bacterium]|nr:YceI family protein [Leptospiraceae bacterium]
MGYKSALLLTLLFVSSPIFVQDWVASSLKLNFSIDTRFGEVKGKFTKISIKNIDLKTGKAIVEVDPSSIDTGNSMRDSHLKSDDFFHVEKFSRANFEFIGLSPTDDPSVFNARGKLTIRGITKDYEFLVTKKASEELFEIEGGFSVNRKDFGITYNSIVNPIKDIVILNFSANLAKNKGNLK